MAGVLPHLTRCLRSTPWCSSANDRCVVCECRLNSSNRQKIRASRPPRALRPPSPRELRPRRRPGPRPRSRTSLITMSSWTREDWRRSCKSCQRSSASLAQSSWKSSRLMDPLPDSSSEKLPALDQLCQSVMLTALISISTEAHPPSPLSRKRPRRRPLPLPRRSDLAVSTSR